LDIAGYLTKKVYTLGAEHFKLLIIATGDRIRLSNVGPSERRLQRGDICRVENLSVIGGYQAGVCRTATVQPPPMAEEIWAHLVACKYMLLDMIKPGASCLKIFRTFIDKLSKMKLPPIGFVGHGIGLHLHEDSYIGSTLILGRPGEDATIEAGMVLGFEPLCYETGYGFGMENMDMLVITEDGCELISDLREHRQTERGSLTGGLTNRIESKFPPSIL
jgi:Xaa-Pro aminopeptidase